MDAEIPQESPQAGNQLFSGADAAPSGAFQKMGAHARRIPARGIVAECPKQLGCTTGILPDGRFCSTAMLLQPPSKVDDECRVGTLNLRRHAASANTDLHEVVAVALGAERGVVVAPPSLPPWTAAGPQM